MRFTVFKILTRLFQKIYLHPIQFIFCCMKKIVILFSKLTVKSIDSLVGIKIFHFCHVDRPFHNQYMTSEGLPASMYKKWNIPNLGWFSLIIFRGSLQFHLVLMILHRKMCDIKTMYQVAYNFKKICLRFMSKKRHASMISRETHRQHKQPQWNFTTDHSYVYVRKFWEFNFSNNQLLALSIDHCSRYLLGFI